MLEDIAYQSENKNIGSIEILDDDTNCDELLVLYIRLGTRRDRSNNGKTFNLKKLSRALKNPNTKEIPLRMTALMPFWVFQLHEIVIGTRTTGRQQ